MSGKRLSITTVRDNSQLLQPRWILAGALFFSAAMAMAAASPAHAALPQDQAAGPVGAKVSPQLFATMCALYAAGFEAEASTPDVDPALIKLREHLLTLQGPATEALRKYYRDHILADSAATMSRYITFALVSGPPPKFAFTVRHEDLPPDALALDDFGAVLAGFYQEAQVEQIWNQFEPAYEREVSLLREPLGQIVLNEAGYLREIVRPGLRTFTVYVEPMVGGRTNVRNIGDQYAVILDPSSNSTGEIRHAFLHFLIDPLPIRYGDKVAPDAPLLQWAARAPRLPDEFRDDFPSFFTECLVHAVELRLRRLPPQELAGEVDSADADGYVLVRPLLSALAKFEASEPAMSLYFPDLVRSIDVVAESKRLQTVAFAPASYSSGEGTAGGGTSAGSVVAAPSFDLSAALAEGDRFIAAQDAPGAAAAYQRVLERVPGQPRALYGLAVAFVLQGNAARARELFEQVTATASGTNGAEARPDPITLAWSHVYLGRMEDMGGEREKALAQYRAALAVADAPGAARVAAQHGIEQSYQPAASGR